MATAASPAPQPDASSSEPKVDNLSGQAAPPAGNATLNIGGAQDSASADQTNLTPQQQQQSQTKLTPLTFVETATAPTSVCPSPAPAPVGIVAAGGGGGGCNESAQLVVPSAALPTEVLHDEAASGTTDVIPNEPVVQSQFQPAALPPVHALSETQDIPQDSPMVPMMADVQPQQLQQIQTVTGNVVESANVIVQQQIPFVGETVAGGNDTDQLPVDFTTVKAQLHEIFPTDANSNTENNSNLESSVSTTPVLIPAEPVSENVVGMEGVGITSTASVMQPEPNSQVTTVTAPSDQRQQGSCSNVSFAVTSVVSSAVASEEATSIAPATEEFQSASAAPPPSSHATASAELERTSDTNDSPQVMYSKCFNGVCLICVLITS